MKNPLKEENNTMLITSIVAGAAVTGTLAYLYFTDDGAHVRSGLTRKIKNLIRDAASGLVSEKTGVPKSTVRKVADHIG